MNTLELDEREARAAVRGAEAALRELRAEIRAVKRQRIAEGLCGECPELAAAATAMQRALERTVGRFERELLDASERFHRAPTERNLLPVRLPANEQVSP